MKKILERKKVNKRINSKMYIVIAVCIALFLCYTIINEHYKYMLFNYSNEDLIKDIHVKLAYWELLKRGPDAVPTLIKAIKSEHGPKGNDRQSCIRMLGQLKDQRAIPVLIEVAINDINQSNRINALYALEEFLAHEEVQAVVEDIAKNDSDPEVQDHAKRLLEK